MMGRRSRLSEPLPQWAEAFHPYWLGRLLTTPIQGLENPAAILAALDHKDTIKAYVEIQADPPPSSR